MGLFSSKPKSAFPWIHITTEAQLLEAWDNNSGNMRLFFKHSTRCSISSMALSRFEEKWEKDEKRCTVYFIDLIAYRSVSNLLEKISGVMHQSPQVIVAQNKNVIYSATHSEIDALFIQKLVSTEKA
jgi:bacillithiol system protein YtxJ